MSTERAESMRQRVFEANLSLAKYGLVSGSSGNASGYDVSKGVVFIKSSGYKCSSLAVDDIVAVDFRGHVVAGSRRPSVDTKHHLAVYQAVSKIKGVVHTHSTYATAFAACAKPIHAFITSIADLFGSEIPCTPYVSVDDDLGGVLASYAKEHPACLVARHGVFSFGPTPEAAVEIAVAVENVARTVFLALSLGPIEPLPSNEVSKWHERYGTKYGQ